MSKKINRKLFFIIFMFALLTFSAFAFTGLFNVKAATYTGIGEERFSWSREVYEGVDLDYIISYNANKDQKTYTLTFDPKEVNLKPIIAYGGDAMYGSTMTSLIDYEESIGNHVVFGINGDAYDTSNGVANGLVISNGELITSSNAALGWGMLADGTVKYGSAKLDMKAEIVGGSTLTLTHVNKERKQNTTGVYLLTERFYGTTESTESGVEVILDLIPAHQNLGLRIGTTLSATVKEVVVVERNPNKNKTQIGKNQVVLSTHTSSPHYATLSGLTVGTQVNFNVNDNINDGIDWSEVEVGLGIFHLLMENGVPTDQINNPDIHPRTSMGIKADGSIVLMQNDGRQFGWANGVSFGEMVEYMQSLGVVTLFNFDGGGSSTIQVTMPGEDRARILNSPSDGHERANTNALLFVATQAAPATPELEKVHLYANIAGNYATKVNVLEKSSMKFVLKGTDNNYYKASLAGKTINWQIVDESSASIGTINSNGEFTASTGAAKGKIVATVGSLSAEFDVEVVDKLTSIETDLTILSTAPGETIDLDFRAYNDNVPVVLSPESLDFSLDPATLGSVSSKGVFTATSSSGTGHITIGYKDFSFKLPVEVGKMPVPILDFESNIFAEGWNRYYTNMPGNGGEAEISINYDERYVKHGDASLRIDYDFASKPLTGTVAIEVGKSGFLTLEGQPTAIGAWVYGDGNGGWFRIQLSGGKYAGDTYIDWVGWKYIETPIPTDAPFPYVVQRAVRLIGTATIGNNKKGTIYVDSVRAIYNFKNDDNDAPKVAEGTISPAQDELVTDVQQEISLRVYDPEGASRTGINTSRTQMYINNKLIDNVQQVVNPDGSVDIRYHPGALDRLRPGVQNVRVRTEDNFGNKTFTEWSFIVDGYAVTLEEEAPNQDIAYAGQIFEYKITTPDYKNFEEVELEIDYNASSLQLVNFSHDSRLTVISSSTDTPGKVKINLIGMNSTTYDPEKDLVTMRFVVKEDIGGKTGIKVTKAIVTEDSIEYNIFLKGYDVEVDYKNILSFSGSTFDRSTRLYVVHEGLGVAGATFEVKANGSTVSLTGTTDNDGYLTTDFFGKYPIDTSFSVRAVKDGYKSNEIEFSIVPSLGGNVPEKIAVNAGADASTSVGIGFQTSHEITAAKIVVSKNSDLSAAVEIEATPKTVYTTISGNDREYTAWGAFVNDLDPDTTYYYKVGSEDGWSTIASFKTAKNSGDLIIGYFGDIQGGYADFANTVDRAHQMYPGIELNIISGDVVDNGHIYSQWTDLTNAAKDQFRNNLWMTTIGNHDTTDGAQALTGLFYGPQNGVEEPLGGSRNYYMEINDMIIFNFDTEAGYNSYDPGYAKQIAHLREVMNNTDKMYRVVLMHRSAYPLNYNEGEIRALAPIFEELNIDLVLSGHDHVYSRTTMDQGQKVEVVNGVTYVVAGTSSGAKYYSGDESRPWVNVVYDKSNRIFNIIKLENGSDLTFESYAIEGGVAVKIDEFSMSKFKVDLTTNEGIKKVNLEYAREGQDAKFKVDLMDNYVLTKVLVNGEEIEFVGNEFIVAEISKDTEVEIISSVVPVASELKISGKFLVGETLTVSYKYSDEKNRPEAGTVIEWFVAGVKVGTGSTLKLTEDMAYKAIEVKVTPTNAEVAGFTASLQADKQAKIYGDINGDGKVNKDDAILILDTITGKVAVTAEHLEALDTSGKFTMADARTVLALIGGN